MIKIMDVDFNRYMLGVVLHLDRMIKYIIIIIGKSERGNGKL